MSSSNPREFITFGVAIAAAGVLVTPARADVYTDRSLFTGDYPSLNAEDFEGIADFGECVGVSGDDTLFDGFVADTLCCGGGNALVCNIAEWPSAVLADGLAADTLRLTFDPGVFAVGFDVGAVTFDFSQSAPVTVAAYDEGGNQLASESFDTAGVAMSTFIGFANFGADIAYVDISSSEFSAIDDMLYGVPAPASALVLASAGACAHRRRRP